MNDYSKTNETERGGSMAGNKNIKAITAAGVLLLAGGVIPYQLWKIHNANTETNRSVLSEIINLSGEVSEGFNHGTIYSIEGIPISQDVRFEYTNEVGDVNEGVRHCALPAFTPVIGVSGVNGMISKCDDVLCSAAYKSNIMARTGDDIQTTLSYDGQIRATELLDAYFPQSMCESATVSVVLQDGAVLVAAGNNSYSYSDVFYYDRKPEHFAVDYTTENIAVGSVAKALTGRALLLNNDKLSKEDSLFNDKYKDLSFFKVENYTIHNWDYSNPDCYTEQVSSEDNLMARYVSFEDALKYSSNTYFLRHTLAFGFQKTFDEMDRIYQMTSDVDTEIYTLPGIECERLAFFFWGQDFKINPIRLCSMYNHALSSKAYTPFYVTSVNTPDGELLYKAVPDMREDLSFDIEKSDKLKEALSECFEYYSSNISEDITAKYSELIKEKRLLAKSGTAEVDELNHINNNTRVLTVLDEKKNVVATACILVEKPDAQCLVNDNILFTILFQTLEVSGVL